MSVSSDTRLIKAVVDTNIFVSGLISANGTPALLIDALRQDRFVLLSSAALSAEVDEVLARPSLARYAFDLALELSNVRSSSSSRWSERASVNRLAAHESMNLTGAASRRNRNAPDAKRFASAVTSGMLMHCGQPARVPCADQPVPLQPPWLFSLRVPHQGHP